MTWTILVEPGHGRLGVGQYDGGQSNGCLIEADLTWQLSEYVAEELQRAAVRHRVLREVREGQGVLLAHRSEHCPDNGTLLSLHFESLPKPGRQEGRIYAGTGEQSRLLAERLAPVVEAWAVTSCRRYGGCEVYTEHAYPHLKKNTITSVLVSPFSVTAPDALVYARRLQVLGNLIAATLASWALGKNPGIRCYQPLTAQRDVSRGPDSKPMGEILRGRDVGEPRKNDTSRRISVVSQGESSE
jgi:hypothetical protein